jgi:hypothetical protein
MTDDDSAELKLAKAIRAEAEVHHKAGDEAVAKAEYERGAAEHARRLTEQMERSIAMREQHLQQLGEAELVAREKAAEQKLAEAQELMQAYNADKHGAAIALQQIDAREKREQAA